MEQGSAGLKMGWAENGWLRFAARAEMVGVRCGWAEDGLLAEDVDGLG